MGTLSWWCTLKHKLSKAKVHKISTSAEVEVAPKKLALNSFCAWDGETLVLNILGTPSAKLDAIGKPKGNQLKVSVTAAPVAGRATDHMVKFLAEAFGVTTKNIQVAFGRMNVNKQLRIHSPKILPSVIIKHLSHETKAIK